jgi:Mrp family chromosome partitioning ATPase
VPPGSAEAAAQGLFASGPLRLRIGELRKEFDYVLIDAPPANSCGDAVLLGQMADGVILVVEANSTRRVAARLAKETFESAEIRLLGGVLNNRTFPIPEALYRNL